MMHTVPGYKARVLSAGYRVGPGIASVSRLILIISLVTTTGASSKSAIFAGAAVRALVQLGLLATVFYAAASHGSHSHSG
jgi:hypothetical protein